MQSLAAGPFSSAEGRTLSRESRGYYDRPIVTTRAGIAAVEAVLKYKALSRSQVAMLTGYTTAVEPTLRTLWNLGYLDRLVTGKTPPVYCAGPALRARRGLRKEDWRLPDAFRLVAANQLAAVLASKKVSFGYEVGAEACVTAMLTIGDKPYVLLAPRLYPGEEQWCRDAINTHDNDARIIVVAATEDQAADISDYIYDVGPQVRFTWDAVLKDRAAFFRREKTFVLEKEY
jgi:hypothetical protein